MKLKKNCISKGLRIKISLEIIMIFLGIVAYYMHDGNVFIQGVMLFCIGFFVATFCYSLDMVKSKLETSGFAE